MSVKDAVKSSFLGQFQLGDIDYVSIIISLLIALLLGMFIFFVYSRYFGGVIYSRSYAVTLIGMSVLTCMVTLAISTNVVISLGMVGSLSIIRYRTAVKSPLDLLYMFWAVTVGITVGAKMYLLALICSAVMFAVIIFFHFRPTTGSLYVAIVHYTGEEAYDNIIRIFGRTKYQIKSKTVYQGKTELTVELFCKKRDLEFYEAIRNVDDVQDLTFIQYNGEYHG